MANSPPTSDQHGSVSNDYLKIASSALLLLLGLIYLLNGIVTLNAPNYGGDLLMRWRERNYLSRRIDPYDVSAQFAGMVPNAAEEQRINEHGLKNESEIGPSGYPPWGLAAAFLFIPPGPLRFVQVVFTILCILSLGLTVWYAFTLGRSGGTASGLLMASTVFAMFSNAGTLRLGQYGLILNALLVLFLMMDAKRYSWAAALAMAVASMKPNFTILQTVAMLVRQKWGQLILIAVVCAAGSAVSWILTGVTPIEILHQMLGQSRYVSQGDTSLLRIARSVMPYSMSVISLGLIGVAATMLLTWGFAAASPLTAVSVAAVMGRIFLYHRQYDNIMLMFPLLCLGLLALMTRKASLWGIFLLFALTMWAPIPYAAYHSAVIAGLSAVWIVGMITICMHSNLLSESQLVGSKISAVPSGRTSIMTLSEEVI
jgi:hypothetical protein